jgi:hypothetical protein
MPNRPTSVRVDQLAEHIALAAGDRRVGLPNRELGASRLVEHGQLLAST